MHYAMGIALLLMSAAAWSADRLPVRLGSAADASVASGELKLARSVKI